MSDESADNAPLPALPLDYFQPSRDSWPPMVRAVSWLVVFFAGYHITDYAIDLICYFWQSTQARTVPRGIDGVNIAIRIPLAFSILITAVGSIELMRLVDNARRWVVAGSLMMLITWPITVLVAGVYSYVQYRYWRYGPPFLAMEVSERLLSAAGVCIVPLFLWKFFRRSEVVQVFNQRHLPRA